MSCVNDSADNTQTVLRKDINVPSGHIVISEKWKDTEMIKHLKRELQVIIAEKLGVVDFYVSGSAAVIFVSESDLVMGNNCQHKILKAKKDGSKRVVIIAEKTATSSQYFQKLQIFVTLTLGLQCIPTTSHAETAQLLAQLVFAEHRHGLNPFLEKKEIVPACASLLNTLLLVPSLGEKKANLLIENFSSLSDILKATPEELGQVVGKTCGFKVNNFFNAL